MYTLFSSGAICMELIIESVMPDLNDKINIATLVILIIAS